ncbi:WD-40 repeat protein [Calothrix sp. NIES-4071]|nr:WD-40 repeat protein [Calothrix sp. NIES-4071]BAZ60054.1 WD-40 repeat protein [Calothrix sp. NIES-4105]
MKQLSKRRNRGVILTLKGWNRLQSARATAESNENFNHCFTVEELGARMVLALHTVSKIMGRTEVVDKGSLQKAFSAFGLELTISDYTQPTQEFSEVEVRRANPQHDWGEAPDVSIFYNRSNELLQLRCWILERRDRLVALLGIGGIGKSTLAVKLGLQVQAEFDVAVWRSLQNAPSVEELLANILQFLLWSLRKEVPIPDSFDGKLSKLMECLSSNRCLIILDNVETILSSGGQTGLWRQGYEGYGQLIKTIAEVPHTSCVILTSTEKPREIALLEGDATKVKSMQLKGLHYTEGRQIFAQKGKFIGTEQQWQKLIEHYGGNPLALKMVAAATQEVFNGRISEILECIEQGASIFDDIGNLLERQFNRLSAAEQEVMYWLAMNQEPTSLASLASGIITSRKSQLLQTVKSLLQRSLIEKSGEQFFLQPIVMEYATQRLIEQVCQEHWESPNLFQKAPQKQLQLELKGA